MLDVFLTLLLAGEQKRFGSLSDLGICITEDKNEACLREGNAIGK